MNKITLTTLIKAPIEVVFDIARDIDAHEKSTSKTNEKAIAGRTSGLIKLGETVTWKAKHLGVYQTLTVKIIEMEAPNMFVDQMQEGAFKSMKHLHKFEKGIDGTLMIDQFEFESPFGIIGKLVDKLFLIKYMENFLIERNAMLKRLAENR